MKRMSVVLRWSLRENLKSKMFLIFLGVMLVATIPAVLGMSSAFKGIIAEGSWEEMQIKLSWIMGMLYVCLLGNGCRGYSLSFRPDNQGESQRDYRVADGYAA